MKEKVYGASYTDAGNKENEDSCLLVSSDKCKGVYLAVISDGVGGLDEGKIASRYVVKSLKKWFLNLGKEEIEGEDMKNLLHEKILDIHGCMLSFAEERDLRMGATLTAAIVYKRRYIIAQIGDSRGYLLEENALRQITKDQTLAQMEIERGIKLDGKELRKKQSVLLQCMGYKRIFPEYFEGEIKDSFILLLCTDGLYKSLTEKEIFETLIKENTGKEKLIDLIFLARKKGEKDDATGVMIGRNLEDWGDEND